MGVFLRVQNCRNISARGESIGAEKKLQQLQQLQQNDWNERLFDCILVYYKKLSYITNFFAFVFEKREIFVVSLRHQNRKTNPKSEPIMNRKTEFFNSDVTPMQVRCNSYLTPM